MPYSSEHFTYGPVFVLQGKHKGRIGDFDDTESRRNGLNAIVYFGHPVVTPDYYLIPIKNIEAPNTQQIFKRHDELLRLISPYYVHADGNPEMRISFLEELSYVSELLNSRMFAAQFEKSPRGAKIFISHSTADKGFVRGLAVDLAAIGHQPWVDEWEILAGESIPERISEGIEDADFVIVVLSNHAVKSMWVKNEWQAKYWAETDQKDATIIPLIIDDCKVPLLLRHKKYVDFRNDYTESLELLSKSLGRILGKKK